MEKIEIKKAKGIKERLDDFYKSKGKELWLYSGHYEDNNLTIKDVITIFFTSYLTLSL